MSRIPPKQKYSWKHRFHGLEHDSKMRLFKTYSRTSTLRGYEAPGKILKKKTRNEERKAGKRVKNTPANGGIDRRESYHFPQISEGNGARENGKWEPFRKIQKQNKCENAGIEGGRVKDLASKNPKRSQSVPGRATYETQLARAEWTSCLILRGRRRIQAENYQENLSRRTE